MSGYFSISFVSIYVRGGWEYELRSPMTRHDSVSVFRHTFLSVIVAILILTAGCTGILSDSDREPEPASTPTDAGNGLTPTDGTDLRSVTIPDNGSTTVSGELDGDDPTNNSTVYEPIQFDAEAGTRVNITMETSSGEPVLRLLAPNGTIIRSTTDGGPDIAKFSQIPLNGTGQYIIRATSSSPDTTFEYTLTIEEDKKPLFAGPPSNFNETEQYLSFGRHFSLIANDTTENGQFTTSVSEESSRANATGDYLVFPYIISENISGQDLANLDAEIIVTYENLDQFYRNKTNNSEDPRSEEWVPERIYFETLNEDGELYRTTFISVDWARQAAETGNIGLYVDKYYTTNRYGPGNPAYNSSGGRFSTTAAAFPLETYDDYEFENDTAAGA